MYQIDYILVFMQRSLNSNRLHQFSGVDIIHVSWLCNSFKRDLTFANINRAV